MKKTSPHIDLRLGDPLYALSLCAHKHERQTEGNTAVVYGHEPFLICASSAEAAEEAGRARALELWPPAQGWGDHSVYCIPVILSAGDRTPRDDESAAEEDSGPVM